MSTLSEPTPQASAKPAKSPPRLPEKKIGPFAGGVGVTIWRNTIETDHGPRQVRSITLNPRRYFDPKSNQWKDAPSYNPADIPCLMFALSRALDYCFEEPLPDQPASEQPAEGGVATNGEGSPF